MSTTAEKISIMQAFEDGQKIEYYGVAGKWLRASTPNWDWETLDFRIKLEQVKPREFWITSKHLQELDVGESTNCCMLASVIEGGIHVREVLEE